MTILYLATGDGPIVIHQRGERWEGVRPVDVRSASCIAADPHRPQRVLCTTAKDGVWRSDDAGQSWRQVFENVPHDRLSSLAISGTERVDDWGVVYVGAEPSAVFRSEDGGDTWTQCEALIDLPSSSQWSFPPRPDTHHVRWIEPDLHERGRLYAAIEAGALVRSLDGGATWRDRVPGGPWDTHQLVMHRDVPGRLWSAAGDGFFESDDAGESWRKAEQGLQHRYCWSAAVDPGDANNVVLSSAQGPRQAHDADQAEGHVYRRIGESGASGEAAWREVCDGLPEPQGTRAYALAAHPEQAGVFYAGSAGSIYHSSDAGESWAALNVDWPAGYNGGRIHVLTVAV